MEENKIPNDTEEKEIINCVDKKGNIIGSVEREEGIEKGILLEAVQLWIINPKTNQVLMQRRASKKENDSNMIDVSASGHVRKNELPTQAMLREAFEEVGVIPTELFPKLQNLMQMEIDFTKMNRKGNYIVHEYLAYLDYPLEYYKKQDEEVEELFFMDYEQLKEEIKSKKPNMRIPYISQTKKLLKIIDDKLYNLSKNDEEKLK